MSGLFSTLFGGIESGNNPNSPNSSTGAQGEYQQFLPFQEQFGGNTSGVVNTDPVYQETTAQNFANQAVANNPTISAGDLYAEYNQGTGNPGSGATFGDLPTSVQSNFNTNASALGIGADTPASTLLNEGSGTGLPAASYPGGSFNPLNWPTSSNTTIGSTGTNVSNLNASAGNIISDPLGTTGVPSTTDPSGNAASGSAGTPSTWFPQAFALLENWGTRAGVIFLGVVLVGIGAWSLSRYSPAPVRAAAQGAVRGAGNAVRGAARGAGHAAKGAGRAVAAKGYGSAA